jgi:hypothetical protein
MTATNVEIGPGRPKGIACMGLYVGREPLTREEREELTETLLEDRGPAYAPWLVREFGPHGGIFMSQLLFWDGKGHDPDGWIYKTEKQMERETGLTRSSQRKARRVLVGKGVLEEDKRGLPRRLHYRTDLRALMDILSGKVTTGQGVRASEEGISGLTGEEDISFLAGEETITSPTSEEGNSFPASEERSTDPAYTETTSENTAEILQRVEAGESPLQGCANREFAQLNQEKEGENQEVEQASSDSSELLSEPTPISEIARKKSRSEQPPRVDSLEIQRINKMLTDKRYPTTRGVYRRFEEGRLSDEQLLEAVSYELTGSFTEGERYRNAVEGCVRILKEEEGIA